MKLKLLSLTGGILIAGLSTLMAQYNVTLNQQCNNSNPATTEVLVFPMTPASATGNATLTIVSIGDISSSSPTSTEHLDYYDENNTLIGQTGGGGNCSTDNFSYTMPQADVNSFASDGQIEITIIPRSGVNTNQCTGQIGSSAYCSTGSLNYPFSTVPNDVGVTSIDSPSVFCAGSHDVVVTVTNFGTNQVDSFTVNWAVNGSAKTPVVVTNVTLDTSNGVGSNTTQVTLGSENFSFGTVTTVEAWTSLPNNKPDGEMANDSASADLGPSLSGNFTIDPNGTGASNYASFDSAAMALTTYGVCGPVMFTVASGTYNEQVSFGPIEGASEINYIKFMADTARNVIIANSSSSSTANYTVQLDGSDFITFEGIVIDANGTTYSRALDINNGASNNTFDNCEFNGYASGTFSTFQCVIYTRSVGNDNNSIINSSINGGSYGIYYYGGGTTSRNENFVFDNNELNDQYYRGAYFYYTTDLKVRNNVFRSGRNYTSMYGIWSYYAYDECEYTGNDINLPGYAGMWLFQNNGRNDKKILVANNFVRSGRMTGSYGYGIYLSSSGYCQIVHNTIYLDRTIGNYYGIFVNGGANTVLNNIIHDQTQRSGSYASLYYSGGFSVLESDYNNVYTNGNFGRISSISNTLADWQSATGFDMNSLESDPGFATGDSLRTCSDTLDGAATPLDYVIVDIDGDERDGNTPDIGADEFIGTAPGSYSAGDDEIICDGKTVVIGQALSDGSFLWSTGDTTSTIEVSTPDTYIVTMTSSCGGVFTDTVEVVDQTPVADFSINTDPNVFLTGDFTNASQQNMYNMWILDLNPADTFYTEDLTYVFPDNGPYDVTLVVWNDCDTTSITKQWMGTVGISETQLENNITVMPNPARDVLNIQFNEIDTDVTIEMNNIQGQVVYRERFMDLSNGSMKSLDVSSMKSGMYIIKFITDNDIATKQLIVE